MRFANKKLTMLSACLALLPVKVVAADDWIKLAESDNGTWEGRRGSAHFSKNNSGEEVVVASGRMTDLRTKQIYFEQWYVRVSACRNGSGKLVTADISGNFKWDTDFVLNGGNIASSLADMLCSFVQERDGKGLSS
ncbi:MAG: hypothetical protein J0J06_15800 [Sphingomonas sp.]|uniref:hypothetical protein n=1 Tax=Sphingomonas sp. TaxID=28214 RepID=UPI001AC5FF4A|nr:hypothetical protein [Sphingomonas sp.]MBN8816897.1 hypothetical protein [Sphingomonas sp.]